MSDTCPACDRPTLIHNRTNGQTFCSRAVDGRCDNIGRAAS
jgi:endogenous inhibitor of DNA gyrase (YacG/DUF329 family)